MIRSGIKMGLATQVKGAPIIRRQYKNWITIAILTLFGRRPMRLLLRNGAVIRTTTWAKFPVLALGQLLEKGWEFEIINDDFIELRNALSTFVCRYGRGLDIRHLAEIFVDEVYGTDFKDKIVLDVGMSSGDSSIYFALKGARRVIGLEPFKPSFDLAIQNIKRNKFEDRIIPLQSGLYSESSTQELRMSRDNPNANSLDVVGHVGDSSVAYDSKMEVKTSTLEEIIDNFDLASIDFLKMDCEGCEYEVVQSLPGETLTKIREIRMEFHNGAKSLATVLSKNNFSLDVHGRKSGYIKATNNSKPKVK